LPQCEAYPGEGVNRCDRSEMKDVLGAKRRK